MDQKQNACRFDMAVSSLSGNLKDLLLAVPSSAKQNAFEVRLRVGMPVALTCAGNIWFMDNHSQMHNRPGHELYLVTQEDIAQSVISMCAYSVHSHQEEMRGGFISLRGGHRAGIGGTAVIQDGRISAVRDISSINLRIARDIEGIAISLMDQVFPGGKLCGVLIAGPPSSGKTTILRDLARQISNGYTGKYIKCVVVDERCEIGAVFDGIPQNKLGLCCDVLSGYPKGEGIWHAVRSLSPQVVLCDEIGGVKEAENIIEGLNCGVKIIATAHAGDFDELIQKPQIRRLLECGAFDKIVQLEGDDAPGRISHIMEAGDLLETRGLVMHRGLWRTGGFDGGSGAYAPCGDSTDSKRYDYNSI